MEHYAIMGYPVKNLIRIVNVPFAKVSCCQKVEVGVVRNKLINLPVWYIPSLLSLVGGHN